MKLSKLAPIALAGVLSAGCDNPVPNRTPREKAARAFVQSRVDKRDSYVCYENPENHFVGMDLGKVAKESRDKVENGGQM